MGCLADASIGSPMGSNVGAGLQQSSNCLRVFGRAVPHIAHGTPKHLLGTGVGRHRINFNSSEFA